MKKLLQFRPDRIMSSLFIILLMCGIQYSVYGQTFGVTECICQNNDSPTAEGLFTETIRISDPVGQTWTIQSANGLYDNTSTPGNLVSFIPGTVIPMISPGVFQITAERVDDTNWEVIISNGVDNYPLTSRHLCQYPGPVLLGDFGVCPDAMDTYAIDAPLNRLSNVNWSVTGGTMTSPNGGQSIDVTWGSIVGLGDVSVSATVASFPGQGAGKCQLNISQPVPIVEEDTVAMACNSALNISMNNKCELYVTPGMMLQDPTYPAYSYEIVLRDIEADTIIPNGIIKMDYLDKYVEVSVVHECSGNSCWGKIRLEDKSIPELVCFGDVTVACDEITTPDETGYPVPDDAVVTKIRDGVYSVIGFDKCTELTMRYEDIVSSVHCTGDFSAVISRTWSIMDDAGNVDTCAQSIFIEKATIDDITFPPNYDDNTGPNPSIQACSNYPTLPNGHPDPYAPGGTGAPEGMFCLNVLVDFIDNKIQKCGDDDKSFKLRRKWIITDECTGDQRERIQFIVVVDKTPPVFAAPDNFNAGTSGLSCASNINVPPPNLLFECSSWDYTVTYRTKDNSADGYSDRTSYGVVRNQNGTYSISDVESGSDTIKIIYTLVDACDNTSEDSTYAIIIDNLPPVPVCDKNSFVALNDEGIGWAGVLTFDDGSHDNCAIDKLEIRRMNPSPCGDPQVWSDKIKFCCEDVGVETMVSLRVTDLAGNSNTCMVLVQVQDNQDPKLVNCPGPRTVNCDADLFNLSLYGFPGVEDLCGADVEEDEPIRNLNNCGQGTVLRTFIATDRSGNTASCTQLITVKATNPFRSTDIKWPGDHDVTNGCMDSGTDPSDLPTGKQFPTYPQKPCSNVTHDYEDVVFQFTDGACFKVLRTWTVLDWCAFDGITGAGIYKHTQVIMVHNNVAPTVVEGCRDQDLKTTDLGDCRSRISITAAGSDDCSLASSLRWKYSLDIGNNGLVDATGNTNVIDRIIDHGTFKVTWTVTDECDNSSTCSKVFTVTDTKKPTPYCLTEIVTVIMQQVKEVSIWASDFNHANNSFDNCTPKQDLRFSFSPSVTDISRTYDCDDLVDGELIDTLRMYVTDLGGNQDFCKVRVRIQDNSGNCEEELTRIAIGGKIEDENHAVISNIEVALQSSLPDFNLIQDLDSDGSYMFSDLPMYGDYKVSAHKKGEYLDGVSTLDLVLIQRHILGISHLPSAYKVIAADVNADNKVSTGDLVELRKLILGLNNEFASGENWRFINSHQNFDNPVKPFPYEKALDMYNADQTDESANFMAVKVGDVNDSHKSNLIDNSTGNRSVRNLISSRSTVNGLTSYMVNADFDHLVGFQFAIEFDAELYEFEGVEALGITIDESNIGLAKVEDGKLFLSWNSVDPMSIHGEMMNILFSNKSEKNGLIALNPGLMPAEVYFDNGIIESFDLNIKEEQGVAAGFEVFQNIPNPFDNTTKIGFNLPNDELVKLTIYDYAGKVLLSKSDKYKKGYNSISLDAGELNASGVMYYTIEAASNSATRKMIVIK